MAILEAIVVLLSLLVFAGASALVFLKERKKAFAFLLIAVGFGVVFVAEFVGVFFKDDPPFVRFLHLMGMALAAFAYLGYLWPRIRDQVRALIARVGVKKGAAAPAAPAAAAPPPAPAPAPAPAEPPPTVPPPAAPSSEPLPPLDLPPAEGEKPPTPPPAPPPS